jgi:hypothetical protein
MGGRLPDALLDLGRGATWSPLGFGTRINRMRAIDDALVYASGDRVYRWAR